MNSENFLVIDTEESLAAIEKRAAPARWPPRLAMVLGLVSLVGAGVVTARLSSWRDAVAAQAAAVRAATAAGSADGAIADLRRDYRAGQARVGAWERRRLGLLLAGLVLLLGGFVASGLLSLHDKMRWVVDANEEDGKPNDPLSSPDSSTDSPPGRSTSHPE